jgi:NADPH:quinone reductase-like Zn-dependent oxidoreductase
MRRYRITGHEQPTVVLEDAPDPRPGHGELRVDLRATSLNSRPGRRQALHRRGAAVGWC